MSTQILKDSNGNPLLTSNSEPLRSLVPITVDLTTLGLTVGTYQLRAKLRGTGYQDSDYSSPIINYTVYSITKTITNGTATGDTVMYPGVDATITIVPNGGYVLPSSVTVTGATLDSYDSSTGAVSISAPTGNVTITCVCEASGGGLPTPKANLNSYTWAEVKQLGNALAAGTINAATLSSTYNIAIGNTKSSSINNETHDYRLIGINHDMDTSNNTLGFTFEQVDLMANTYDMKSSMSDTDSWQNSDLKTTLEGFTVASDLVAVITPAKKVCANNVSGGTPTYNYINTTNGLFIASETEVFGTQNYTIGGTIEGSQYEWYANGGSAVKQRAGSNAWWWLRSPYDWAAPIGRSRFARGYDDGSVQSLNSSNAGGVAPCFCI